MASCIWVVFWRVVWVGEAVVTSWDGNCDRLRCFGCDFEDVHGVSFSSAIANRLEMLSVSILPFLL